MSGIGSNEQCFCHDQRATKKLIEQSMNGNDHSETIPVYDLVNETLYYLASFHFDAYLRCDIYQLHRYIIRCMRTQTQQLIHDCALFAGTLGGV